MAKVRETVEIDAPIEKVWAVVHEDFKNAGKWTNSLDHVDTLTDGPFGKGTELRYTINTHGGKPQGACSKEGAFQSVAYAADYVFLKKA